MGELVILPPSLRGYLRYVVLHNPEDNRAYSVGIRYVLNTTGSQTLLQRLEQNRQLFFKHHIKAPVCESVLTGRYCESTTECKLIHVTVEGWALRRLWAPTPLESRTLVANKDIVEWQRYRRYLACNRDMENKCVCEPQLWVMGDSEIPLAAPSPAAPYTSAEYCRNSVTPYFCCCNDHPPGPPFQESRLQAYPAPIVVLPTTSFCSCVEDL
eukprot:TRINITY_DN16937_c1_g1_i1.p1 TRINITY_DN16937_c1_g1~~TRINITY_DN16937_c1_g1_i1.p1  ORF type:complete len:212 (+),score=7.62 TRINITY_DN16937_c1_g1_i1:63-698(+)